MAIEDIIARAIHEYGVLVASPVVGARLPPPESLQVLHDVDVSTDVIMQVRPRLQRPRPYAPHPTSRRAKAPRLRLPLHLTFLHHRHRVRFPAPYLQIRTSSSRPHLTLAGHIGQRFSTTIVDILIDRYRSISPSFVSSRRTHNDANVSLRYCHRPPAQDSYP